jgi:hypothetical protein
MAETAAQTFKLPALDLEALFALQKANLAAAQEAQNVLLDAAQAITRLSWGYVQELAAQAEASLKPGAARQPEAVLAQVQASAEKAVAVTRQGVELGLAAQRRVSELLADRAAASVDGFKAALAA